MTAQTKSEVDLSPSAQSAAHSAENQPLQVNPVEPPAEKSPPIPGVVIGEVRLLDPKTVRVTPHPNRDEASYETDEFEAFEDTIKAAGGNVQPVIVRRLAEPVEVHEFELVSGHRRHRACSRLGLSLRAFVQNGCTDQQACLIKLQENAGRLDLSPFELGKQVLDAIQRKQVQSIRSAAQLIGRDKSDLAKAVQLAQLPPEVTHAFASTAELQYRHAKLLSDAMKVNKEAVIAEANRIAQLEERPATAEIADRLAIAAKGGVGRSHTPNKERHLQAGGQYVGRIKFSRSMKTQIEIDSDLGDKEREALAKFIERIVAKKLAKPAAAEAATEVTKP